MYEIEIWKDIENHKQYQVSNLVKVRSFTYYGKEDARMMKFSNSKGYKVVTLNGKLYKIHRLVAMAFIPNPENKPYINHLDGDKTNNMPNNLAWCTAAENNKHAWDIGLSKITEKQRESSRRNGSTSRCRMVLNTSTGVYYNSAIEAIASLSKKISKTLMCMKLNNQRRNNTDFIYV